MSESAADIHNDFEWQGRAILLVDLDAFFASVEQLDHPGWRGKPVIVGGSPERRGVVSTASYEARAFGVHSAMPSSVAQRLCPEAFWTEGHYSRYKEISDSVMGILRDETPFCQQVSIDEAFLDITPTRISSENPVAIAQRIQNRVASLGVSCSIGLGTTKAIAKLASDQDKPQGLTVVYPGSERGFLDPFPVRALSGIGPAAEKKLASLGITTLGELAQADDEVIEKLLGKSGRTMLDRVRCKEDDVVEQDVLVKSISNETSFAESLVQRSDIVAAIYSMSAKVARRARKKGLKGNTLALKVRYEDLAFRSVQHPLSNPTNDSATFNLLLDDMLQHVWKPGMKLRLVGVALSGLEEETAPFQLNLFDMNAAGDQMHDTQDPNESFLHAQRIQKLTQASDKLKDKYGESAVMFGRELRTSANTTGTSAKNPEDYK